jgi:hypothetical protein
MASAAIGDGVCAGKREALLRVVRRLAIVLPVFRGVQFGTRSLAGTMNVGVAIGAGRAISQILVLVAVRHCVGMDSTLESPSPMRKPDGWRMSVHDFIV